MTRIRCNEGSSGQFGGRITDASGKGVAAADIASARVTLVDVDSDGPGASPDGTINGRKDQSVISEGSPVVGANGLTFGDDGAFTFTLDPEDNVRLNSRKQVELHRARFEFAWDGGAQTQEFDIEVVQL